MWFIKVFLCGEHALEPLVVLDEDGELLEEGEIASFRPQPLCLFPIVGVT